MVVMYYSSAMPYTLSNLTHLLPVPRRRPHAQRPILDRTRRQVIQDHMIRYRQNTIVVQSRRNVPGTTGRLVE